MESMPGIDADKMQEIKDLCIDRWDIMHAPLHAVAYMLHPVWKGKGQDSDSKVHDGWMTFLEKYTKGDLDLQGNLIDEYDKFKVEGGTFARPIAKEEKRLQEGVKWWETFGACTPKLQALALRVLSQGSCASPCERNWSTFSLIHTKRRNRLLPSHTEKLVYIHTNLRLISKIKERGYERMEVTLEMLNKEKDEDRLLALQDLQEAIAELDDASEPISLDLPLAAPQVAQPSSTHVGTSCPLATETFASDDDDEEEEIADDVQDLVDADEDEDEDESFGS